MVAGRVDALDGELGVGVNAAALDRRAVVALLLSDDVLGALQGLQVGVEEASLLAGGLVAADHLEVLLEHFRLILGGFRGGPRAKFNCSFCKLSQD